MTLCAECGEPIDGEPMVPLDEVDAEPGDPMPLSSEEPVGYVVCPGCGSKREFTGDEAYDPPDEL